jgi:hypothetical protein
MVILLRDFGSDGIIFMTMCVYYFEISCNSWRKMYYLFKNGDTKSVKIRVLQKQEISEQPPKSQK